MLTFLEPGVLWALPLAGVPILLHLLFLRRARRIRFSSLELLRAAYLRALPATRLRQWLLLLARCLAVALLVAAFARPVLRPAAAASGAEGDAEGLDAVVLADTSWSMRAEVRGKPRWELAAAAGAEFLKHLRPSDRAAVAGFSAGLDSELAWSASRSAAAESLSRLKPGWRTTDLPSALQKAYAFLAARRASGPTRRRAILLLTDDARHALSPLQAAGGPAALEGFDPGVVLLGLRWDETVPNSGVRDAAPAQDGAGDDGAALAARIETFGGAPAGLSLDAWVRGRRVEQRVLVLDESAPRQELFRFPPQPEGELYGRLELRRDALPADDSSFFSLKVQPRPRVLYLHGSPNAMQAGRSGYFFRKLLGEAGRLPYRFDAYDLGRLPQLRLDDYAALILDETRSVQPEEAEALKRFVLRGGGLWLIAGTQAEHGALQPLWALLPGLLGPASPAGAEGLRVEVRTPAFRWEEFELGNVSVHRRYEVEAGPGSAVLFRDGGGAPLLLERSFGRGRVLLWASSFDLRWSNLALKPVFSALADACLSRLTGFTGSRRWRTSRVGEPLVRAWEAGEEAPLKVEVQAPDGRRTSVHVLDRRAVYAETREPGLYFLKPVSGGDPAGLEAFAVNADRSTQEGDLRPGSAPWKLLRPSALREDLLLAVYGREARAAALAGVLLLLALELLLARLPAAALVLALVLPLRASPACAQEGDRFVWAQVRYNGAWDPYPGAHKEALGFLTQVTSVLSLEERRELPLKDPRLFSTPMLYLTGRMAPPSLDDEELRALRNYLTSGGFLWVDDAAGIKASEFDRWVRSTLRAALPDSDLRPLGQDHVLFKTFFLVRRIGGRAAVSGSVEGVDWGGKTVVVYSRNDLMGAWAKDPLGKPLYDCAPGGEAQRFDAKKLTLNILMYALTGSYKADAVHQPYILEKMRQGVP